jgi:hypothetical protein
MLQAMLPVWPAAKHLLQNSSIIQTLSGLKTPIPKLKILSN